MSPSLVAQVSRAHTALLVLAALAIVVVASIAFAGVVVVRDDAEALALGRLLAMELDDHHGNHDRVVRHELEEQRWFERTIEVWRGEDRIGGDEGAGRLAAFAGRADGTCEHAVVGGARERVCIVRTGSDEAVIVASDVGEMLASMAPMVGTLALVAAIVTLAVALVGRRVVARALAPLGRFEAEVAAVPPRGPFGRLTDRWGSRELDSLSATFGAMLERIDLAVAREQRFVADAAHELRTPLTRLRAQLELARAEHAEGKPVDERLAASVRTAIELATTTEALLAMARDSMGTSEPVELADVVDTCVARLEPGLRARVKVSEASALADGVEPLLVLAVGNLVDNALKYAPGEVEIEVSATDAEVAVRVADRGPGIDGSERERVLEPFVRGASAEGIRGAGLGLALASHVAQLHQGALTLDRREPRGLVATLSMRPWSGAEVPPPATFSSG